MLKTLWSLFSSFMRIGALTFGGGYAMLPMMEAEIVERRHWAAEEEMMDYYALAQCTPGAISVNVSTFIGYKIAGVAGAVIATLGLVFPSLVIICIIAAFLGNISDAPLVRNAFAGVRVGVAVLMVNAVVKLGRASLVDLKAVVIFAAVFAGSIFTDISPVVFVVLAAVAGILIQTWGRKTA